MYDLDRNITVFLQTLLALNMRPWDVAQFYDLHHFLYKSYKP